MDCFVVLPPPRFPLALGIKKINTIRSTLLRAEYGNNRTVKKILINILNNTERKNTTLKNIL